MLFSNFSVSESAKLTKEELSVLLKDERRPVFVAQGENESIYGYCFCIFKEEKNSNILTGIKALYIDDLCVDKNARGQNIGTKLYSFAVDFAKQSGCYNVTLNVWACNQSALKFYEKLGLKPQKIGMETIL